MLPVLSHCRRQDANAFPRAGLQLSYDETIAGGIY
jgi:hypothetical protein